MNIQVDNNVGFLSNVQDSQKWPIVALMTTVYFNVTCIYNVIVLFVDSN